MEVGQTLEFIWDSQIEPFIELNMGLDNIINQFRADFVRRVIGIWASQGYTQLPKNSFMVKFFADKDNVVASFMSSSYYESFMQVLECVCVRARASVDLFFGEGPDSVRTLPAAHRP